VLTSTTSTRILARGNHSAYITPFSNCSCLSGCERELAKCQIELSLGYYTGWKIWKKGQLVNIAMPFGQYNIMITSRQNAIWGIFSNLFLFYQKFKSFLVFFYFLYDTNIIHKLTKLYHIV